MTISANNFTTGSLAGPVTVQNSYANIVLSVIPFAFEGDKSFNIKLRRNSTQGEVIATTPTITIKDNAELVSFVANNYSITEGQDVLFTLTTINAANNVILYYSTESIGPNVDFQDIFGGNVGTFTLVDNVGTILLNANADYGPTDESGEKFKLQIRTGSIQGNVVLLTDNVTIQDTTNVVSFFPVETSTSIVEGGNVSFSITSVLTPNNTTYYYTTIGNVTSQNFVSGNTGSFSIVNNVGYINLLSSSTIPAAQERSFSLQIREDSISGPIRATSNVITILDSSLVFVNATGGTVYYDTPGYKVHVFTTSGNLLINSLGSSGPANQIHYLVVGGGGSGGVSYYPGPSADSWGTGGGAGGFLSNSVLLTAPILNIPIPVIVGAGGATSGVSGSNTSLVLGQTIIAYGGGAGGGGGTNPTTAGSPGGSGGGGSPEGLGTTGQGNPGGRPYPGMNSTYWGGGGGGASGFGEYLTYYVLSGKGGAGNVFSFVPNLFGTTGPSPGRWFAGGGSGAGTFGTGGYPQPGGVGGGGATYTAGVVNSGGGGGGSTSSGALGGSGIVVISYPYTAAAYTIDNLSFLPTKNSNITFNIRAYNVPNNTSQYYNTTGNILVSEFVGANTGSFTIVNGNAIVTLRTQNIPAGETRTLGLQLKLSSADGEILTESSTYTITDVPYELLVIGGGGGGAGGNSGSGGMPGAGAGGVVYITSNVSIGLYGTKTFVIGAGGSISTSEYDPISSGSNTRIGEDIIALGGGGSGRAGGSGGGAYSPPVSPGLQNSMPGISGTYGYGNPGGERTGIGAPGYPGAGGGGAGTKGLDASGGGAGANGGNGIYVGITGTGTYYAGGGAGGSRAGPGTPGLGASNAGGGGIGAGDIGYGQPNHGAGQPGAIYLAYPTAYANLSIAPGISYTQYNRSGYRVFGFTSGSGNVTLP